MILGEWTVLLLIFLSVSALALGVAWAMAGVNTQRLKLRLQSLRDTDEIESSVSVIRAHYLRQLSPVERWLESLPGMVSLRYWIEQAGHTIPAYRVALIQLFTGTGVALLAALFVPQPIVVVAAFLLGATLPVLKLWADRRGRLERFEEQLPDAIDLMTRSLRAGSPLQESFKFVAEEMSPPISQDFERAWSLINFGVSLKASLMDMLERTPNVSLRSMVTAILVQRETGGNLAELLDKISDVLRGRVRFQRRLRSLTAEGRMSAAVLVILPFALAGMLMITSPSYLPILIEDPNGQKLIAIGLGLMAIGIFWISRAIRVRV
jgi:tight adherence protein B